MRTHVGYIPALCLSIHAAAFCVVLAFTAIAGAEPTPDANIGAGLGMVTLAALGLPWSAFYFVGAFGEVTDLAEVALFASTAVFNLVLHGLAWIAHEALRLHRRGS